MAYKIKLLIFIVVVIIIMTGCINNTNIKQDIKSNTTDSNIIENQFTDISQIKQLLDNIKTTKSLSGYLIHKTKSCIFRTTDPPYPPGAPCAPDSGYFILSDSNIGLTTNPVNEKTILNENQILVFSIPDSVINNLSLGEIYTIEGSVKKWNGFNSIKYFRIQDIIDCKKLENEIIAVYEEANYCDRDSDCIYRPNLGFCQGCRIYNKNFDLSDVRSKEKKFYDFQCPSCEVSCYSPDLINLKCIENECTSVKK